MNVRTLVVSFLVGAVVAGGAAWLLLRRGTDAGVVADAPPAASGAADPAPDPEPAPAAGVSTEQLLALEAKNRELEGEAARLEARLTELEPPPLDPDAFRFGLPEKTPAFDKADWPTLCGHAAELSKLLAELRERIVTGQDVGAGFQQRIIKHNTPLALFAVAFGAEMEDATPNGAYTHPAVVANMIRAALQDAGKPLSHDQEIAIKTLGDAWVGERRRAAAATPSSQLAALVAEVDAKLRFLASVKNVLTEEQRGLLFHPETEGRLKLDLLSPALVYVLTQPVEAESREDMQTKLLRGLFDQAGIEIDDPSAYAWISERWVDEIPRVADPLPVRSVDLRFPHVDVVQARARAQATAIERVLAMGGLTDEQVKGLRAIGTLIYPFVIQRDS